MTEIIQFPDGKAKPSAGKVHFATALEYRRRASTLGRKAEHEADPALSDGDDGRACVNLSR
jgi:hypothetical protein